MKQSNGASTGTLLVWVLQITGQAQGQERLHPGAGEATTRMDQIPLSYRGQSKIAAGDSGNARPCLGRETPGNDLPKKATVQLKPELEH